MNRTRLLAGAALAAMLTCLPVVAQPEAPAPPELRLPDLAKPTRQSVELTIDPSLETFTGVTEIAIELKAATPFLWLHGRDLQVSEASALVGGASVPARAVAAGEDFLGLAFQRPVGPGRTTLRLAYQGQLSRRDTEGLFAQQEGGDWYVFSQFESVAARRAFPCFDEPSFKIPWTVTLRIPKALAAVSNTPQASSSDGGDGWTTVRFAETPPLPSYLVALAVGPFEFVDAGKAGRKDTPLRVLTPRGRAADARWAKETSPVILKLLEDYFDTPYPYAKLDQVAIPITVSFGAMENAGLVTWSQSLILRRPQEESIGFRRTFASICAHELAHMWFGDLVTMAWWDDVWLNESFASWMASKTLERWKPEWEADVERVLSRGGAMKQDSLATARAIRQPIRSSHDIASAFDAITYSKGEAVLEMFESWLGPEPFRRGVQEYLRAHAWGNASAADFLAALGAASQRDVAAAFSTFLDQSGVPLVAAELVCANDKPRLTLQQRPYRPIGSKESAAKSWRVPVCVEQSGAPDRRQCTLLDKASGEVALEAAACPDWLQGNAGGSGYYRVAYRGDLLARLVAGGGRQSNVAERVSLLQDLGALVRSGDLPAGEALAVVPVMLADPNRHIVSATASLVSTVAGDNVVSEALRPKLARFLRETYGERARALGWSAKPGEDEDARLLRQTLVELVAVRGEDAALGAAARELVLRWLSDPTAIDPDMVGVALQAAAHHGDRALFDKLLEVARNEKQDRLRRQRLLGALASFGDPAIVKDALAIPLDEGFDFRESLSILSAATSEPRSREMAWAFFRKNYAAIETRMPQEGRAFLPYAAVRFCDEGKRAEAEAFFRPRVAAAPGGPRNLDQVLEQIELCAAYKDAQQRSVAAFLEKY